MTMHLKMMEAEEIGIEKGIEIGREEGIEIGMEKGMEKGILHSLISLVKDGLLDLSTAAERLNMTIEEFRAAMASADTPHPPATTEIAPPHAEGAEDRRQNV